MVYGMKIFRIDKRITTPFAIFTFRCLMSPKMGLSTMLLPVLSLLTIPPVAGFSFNTSTPTQCGEFTVQWDGGEPPFGLVIVPAETVDAGRILNVTIPEDVSPPYSYTFELNEPAGLDFLATMYDAEGWGTGGTTPILTVGSSSNTSCLSSNLDYAFYFYVDPQTPSQCQTMSIGWPNNVTLPVSLYGMIPGGTAFELPVSQSLQDTTYDWTVDIAQGTDVLLLMADASSTETGGSTSLLEVGQGSTGCMSEDSPRAGGNGGSGSGTATSAAPSASISGVGGTSGGGSSGQGNNGEGDGGGHGGDSGGTNIGAIVGGTLGGVAFIVLLALLLICCVKRRVRDRRGSGDSSLLKNYGMSSGGETEEKRGRFDILAGVTGGRRNDRDGGLGRSGSDAETRVGGEEYQPSPFRYPSPPPGSEAAAAAAAANRANVPPTAFRGSKEGESRPSFESGHTGSNQTPVTGSQAGRTDEATTGHGVQRGSSTRKSAVPPSPSVNTSRRAVDDTHTGGFMSHEGGDEARFVQHQDNGPVVDLPPRYDQLRPRNPDT